MGIRRYRYLHFDVFTDQRFGGNQLAVFPEAAGLADRTMQLMAREMNFAWMTQRLPEFGPMFEPSVVAPAIGVGEHAIAATGLPIQQVSCGVPFVIVPLDTRASVDDLARARRRDIGVCRRRRDGRGGLIAC